MALYLKTLKVLPSWANGLGVVAELWYLHCASEATDAFLPVIGVDLDYVSRGYSYYAVETQITKFALLSVGDELRCDLQILMYDQKRIQFLVTVTRADRVIVAIEQMYIHVDKAVGKSCDAPSQVFERLKVFGEAHKLLQIPDVVGRSVGKSEPML